MGGDRARKHQPLSLATGQVTELFGGKMVKPEHA